MLVVNIEDMKARLLERSMSFGWGREEAEEAASRIRNSLGLLYAAVDFGGGWSGPGSRWKVVKLPDLGDETCLLSNNGRVFFTGIVEFVMPKTGLARTTQGVYYKRHGGRYGAAWIEAEGKRGGLALEGPRFAEHSTIECIHTDCPGCAAPWALPRTAAKDWD